ncbi:MAG: 2-oxo acid dehydrogenase subunit E2 [Clostridia bacterium]|nr:2-oxo acid dehydrogenase subunit E2 [Clostridia bacterium]
MSLKNFLDVTLHRPMDGDTVEYFGEVKKKCNGYVLSNATTQPTAAYAYEADITKLWDAYKELKAECGYPLSFNTIMMKAMVEGLKVAPRLNAHIDFKPFSVSGRMVIKKHMNIAMPVVLNSGETFPVNIINAEEKNLKELQEQITDVVTRMKTTNIQRTYTDMTILRSIAFLLTGKIIQTIAMGVKGAFGKSKMGDIKDLFNQPPKEENALAPEHVKEGTVCFSNWGTLSRSLNGMGTQAPLLYPQVFMMGVGTIQDKEFAFRNSNGEIDLGVKKVMPITLTFDHRIGAFNDVIPFIKVLDEIFENPSVIKEW